MTVFSFNASSSSITQNYVQSSNMYVHIQVSLMYVFILPGHIIISYWLLSKILGITVSSKLCFFLLNQLVNLLSLIFVNEAQIGNKILLCSKYNNRFILSSFLVLNTLDKTSHFKWFIKMPKWILNCAMTEQFCWGWFTHTYLLLADNGFQNNFQVQEGREERSWKRDSSTIQRYWLCASSSTQ